jgi:hypothetical protein
VGVFAHGHRVEAVNWCGYDPGRVEYQRHQADLLHIEAPKTQYVVQNCGQHPAAGGRQPRIGRVPEVFCWPAPTENSTSRGCPWSPVLTVPGAVGVATLPSQPAP